MISVITCPRPGGVSYLRPLLSAVSEACPGERCVLLCSGPLEFWPGWVSVPFSHPAHAPRDNKFVGWAATERAASLGEDLLFLEDDVSPADATAVADAVRYEVPLDCGFASLHRSRWTTPGTHEAGKFMMSQAVKIPARSFAHLLDWHRRCSGDWEAIFGVDIALATAGHNARWKYEQTERNYFNHVGEVSSVRNGADGRSVAF